RSRRSLPPGLPPPAPVRSWTSRRGFLEASLPSPGDRLGFGRPRSPSRSDVLSDGLGRRVRLGGRRRHARLELLDLVVELLDLLRQVADLVAGGHAEAVEGRRQLLVELVTPGLEGALGLGLHLVDLGLHLLDLDLAARLHVAAALDHAAEDLAPLLLRRRQRAEAG